MSNVKKGDKVRVEYVGTLEDGTVFDSSELQGCLLEFEVGAGSLLEKIEESVLGMTANEEKEITLQPEEAYGEHNPEFVRDIPRDYFPQDQDVQPGMFFMMVLQDGRQMPVRIAQVSEENVTIDINHPLAGKVLKFKIKIIEIIEQNGQNQ